MKAGFSIIELLVVIAVIAILTAVAIPVYSEYRIRTKLIDAVTVLETVDRQLLSMYEVGEDAPQLVVGSNTFTLNTPFPAATG